MTSLAGTPSTAAIERAVRAVEDPEYAGVTIDDLGMVGQVRVDDDAVHVELVPTMAGCPALAMIASDVRQAVAAVAPGTPVDVQFGTRRWDIARVSQRGRQMLADGFAVTLRTRHGELRCPTCGSTDLVPRADVGSVRCRAVHWCPNCRNPVDELRA